MLPAPDRPRDPRRDRARAVRTGLRSAVLVTLVAAGVAACVSAGSESDPKAPKHAPGVSAGTVADGSRVPRGAGD
ncbi:hypothetical protein, partial [Streptomyces sp. CBMA29]|uniref:hypothetical protein n=1 Tax=Streptomyces sp. CBMA29 TaxID=1896314 RepID=UPI001CB705E1